jgi:thioredoxin 1
MSAGIFAVLDETNFSARVLQREGLTIVDFWSSSCVPCKQMDRLLTQLATEIPTDVLIGTVNSDQNPALVERYGVRGLPTLLFFKDGQVVETRTGVDRRQVLKKLVEAHA